jgi:uncharacterized protein (TIGR00255 family)
VSWEIRSINHRYLDLHFHMLEQGRELEAQLRKELQQALTRGKVDIYLNYVNHAAHSDFHLNQDVVQALIAAHQQLKQQLPTIAQPSMFDILRWPGVIKMEQTLNSDVKNVILQSFQEALSALVIQRQREGGALTEILQNKLQEIAEKLTTVTPRREQVLHEQRQKFFQRIESLQLVFDPNRLEQELFIWAQKSDIAEEIDRLHTHLQEASHILQKGGKAVGRQLEFLVQELQREANTLTSKSSDPQLTSAAVDIKVCIEQIREQLQNIA